MIKQIPLLFAAITAMAASALAQVPYTSGTYSQPFDSLITSGSTAWIDNLTVPGFYSYMIKKAAPFPWLLADTGKGGSTATIYSYGAAMQPERALGMMPGSTPGDVLLGVRITNNSGHTLTSFTASYDGEEWRACCTAPQMLQVDYQLGSPATLNSGTWADLSPMDFTGPIVSATGNYSLDGNAAANSVRNIASTVGPIVWPPGTDVWIRWKNAWLTGANASLAVDNFRFRATSEAIIYNGGVYSESFDSLPMSGSNSWTDSVTLPGWYTYRSKLGTETNIYGDNGNNGGTGWLYSYGATSGTDRALGSLPGSTPGDVMVGVRVRNNTGRDLKQFTLTYDGEEWRASCLAPQMLQVAYQVGTPANLLSGTWNNVPALNFTAPIVSNTTPYNRDGNAVANSLRNISYTVPVNWPKGADLWIRWINTTNTGNAGLGLDNVRISGTDTVVTPGAFDNSTQSAYNAIATVDTMLLAGRTPEVRQMTQAAYLALAMNIPGAVYKAEYYMTRDFNCQLSDGNFPWYVGGTSMQDANCVEFTMNPVAVIFLKYLNKLDSSFVSFAHPHIQSAITAIKNHAPTIDYTNIYTMKFVNLLLLGQVENDATALSTGTTNLNAWVKYVKSYGNAEYDSPTYSQVTFNNLMTGYNNVTDPYAKSQLKGMADFLSFDISANYLNAYSGCMAGALSRDYTFTTSDTSIQDFYYFSGVRDVPPGISTTDCGPMIANEIEGGYLPATTYTAISTQPVRVIRQVNGADFNNPNIGKDRYTYITPDFAIGSASRFYSYVDKLTAASFPAARPMCQISVVYDYFDNPYGTIKVMEPGTGALKVLHAMISPSTVQEKGTILGLANMYPQFALLSATNTYTSLATNFLLPNNADKVYLDGNVIAQSGTTPATVNSVVGVRQGNGMIVVRPFVIDGRKGYTPTAAVKFDGDNAGRFVCYHYQGPATTISGTTSIRTGYVMAARSVTSDSDAVTFINDVKNAPVTTLVSGTWNASVTLSGTTLAAAQTVPKGDMVYRRVNGADYSRARYSVSDGTTPVDYAAKWLDTVPSN